jgi:glucosamine kinase
MSPFKIGVDGGGTKTELILVDDAGAVIGRHTGPGCNPSVVGPANSRKHLLDCLTTLLAPYPNPGVQRTLLCMAGSGGHWQETAETLSGFGDVEATDDAVPVLELATNGSPGLVLHAGTGSFVAVRGLDGEFHYTGGLGWRFGDEGSGYDIGRRAIGRALAEFQGWLPASGLSRILRDYTGLNDGAAISRYFYHDTAPNQKISAFSNPVLRLASEGDEGARRVVTASVDELLTLAETVIAKYFPGVAVSTLSAGLSGPILTQRYIIDFLRGRTSLALNPVSEPPIEGVRRLLIK